MYNNYDARWVIGNHTRDHTTLSGLTQAQVETALKNAEIDLIAQGMPNFIKHVAYPGGAYDDTTLAAMADLQMRTGRTVNGTVAYNSYPVLPWFDNIYTIPLGKEVYNTDSLASIETLVDTANTNGTLLVLLFHTLVASPSTTYQWGIANFQALCNYINAAGLPCINVDDAYNLQQSQRITTRFSPTYHGYSHRQDGNDPIPSIFTNRTTATNSDQDALTIETKSLGSPAAGLGAALRFALPSDVNNTLDAARIIAEIITATDASRAYRLRGMTYDVNGAREGWRIDADGAQALLSFYGAAAVAKPSGNIFTALTNLGLITSPSLLASNIPALAYIAGSVGSAFPGSPATNDLFYRTDLGLLCYYDGAEWLTVEEYVSLTGSVAASVNTTGNIQMLRDGYQPYFTRCSIITNVATTNDGSNYWTVKPRSLNKTLAASTDILSFTTSADTVAAYTDHSANPSTAKPTNYGMICTRVDKTGSPGTISCYPTYHYRLIIT
jgi:hypothetical protein